MPENLSTSEKTEADQNRTTQDQNQTTEDHKAIENSNFVIQETTETQIVEIKEEDPKTNNMSEDKPIFTGKMLSGIFKILTFILSLPALASFVWLLYMGDYDCEKILRLPKLQFGIVLGLIFVFAVSIFSISIRSKFPMPALLVVLVPLLVKLTMGLALLGAYNMESRSIPASPIWLKFKIYDNNNWNNIKTCIFDTRACDDLRSQSLKSYDFSLKKLSYIEYGCCKPPINCGLEYVNVTFWEKKDLSVDNSTYVYNRDCELWSNNRTTLCYNCNTCKEGYLKTLKRKWWKLGMFLAVMASLLIVSHLLLFLATMWERYGK